jgi:holo-[acyl-carrier protein] synthase
MIVGVGIDIVEIDRMRRILESKSDRLIERVFTTEETRYALAHVEPALHFAARIAAKEATYKALSGNPLARAVGWREIEVLLREDGAPYLMLHGRARDRAAELAVERSLVSLTHSKTAAVAVVILER